MSKCLNVYKSQTRVVRSTTSQAINPSTDSPFLLYSGLRSTGTSLIASEKMLELPSMRIEFSKLELTQR